jgi:hypothetical protein
VGLLGYLLIVGELAYYIRVLPCYYLLSRLPKFYVPGVIGLAARIPPMF